MKKILGVNRVDLDGLTYLKYMMFHLREAVSKFNFKSFSETEKSPEISSSDIRFKLLKAVDQLESEGRIEMGSEYSARERHSILTNTQAVIESLASVKDIKGERVFIEAIILVHTPEPSTPMRMDESSTESIREEKGFSTVELRHNVLTKCLRNQEGVSIFNIYGQEKAITPRDPKQIQFFNHCVENQDNLFAVEIKSKDGVSIFDQVEYRGATIYLRNISGELFEFKIRQEQVGASRDSKSVLSVSVANSGISSEILDIIDHIEDWKDQERIKLALM